MTKKLRYIIYIGLIVVAATIIAAVMEAMSGQKTDSDGTVTDAVTTASDASGVEIYVNLSEGDYGKYIIVLDAIRDKLNISDYAGAAKSILDSEDILSYLWTDILSERPAYYAEDGTLVGNDTGRGLMITGDGFFYYGDFVDGVPQGGGCAFTAYTAVAKQYMYSTGSWEQGHMQGSGETGYAYLEDLTERDDVESKMDSKTVISARKKGVFVDDQMDGEVTMTIIYLDGQTVTYKLMAKMGTTDISDWEYDSDRESYKLASVEDSSYMYELGKNQIDQLMWFNPLGGTY